jgi:hypothetical protein
MPWTRTFVISQGMRLVTRRRLALVLLLVALGSAVWEVPSAFRSAGRDISDWAGMGPTQRELAPARYAGISGRILLGAARIIPPDTLFAVVTGRPTTRLSPFALLAAPSLSYYWLFPRRHTNDLGQAAWVLSYNKNIDRLGLSYSRVLRLTPDVTVAEVRR